MTYSQLQRIAGVLGQEPITQSQWATVFQGDINAIGNCAQRNRDRDYQQQSIAIFSNSQDAISV